MKSKKKRIFAIFSGIITLLIFLNLLDLFTAPDIVTSGKITGSINLQSRFSEYQNEIYYQKSFEVELSQQELNQLIAKEVTPRIKTRKITKVEWLRIYVFEDHLECVIKSKTYGFIPLYFHMHLALIEQDEEYRFEAKQLFLGKKDITQQAAEKVKPLLQNLVLPKEYPFNAGNMHYVLQIQELHLQHQSLRVKLRAKQ